MDGDQQYDEPLLPNSALYTQTAFLSTDRSDLPTPDHEQTSLPAHIMGALLPPLDMDESRRQTFVDPKYAMSLWISADYQWACARNTCAPAT